MYRGSLIAALSTMLSGCLGIPENATAVRGFELERYLGTWYEIARLDHRFERGLNDKMVSLNTNSRIAFIVAEQQHRRTFQHRGYDQHTAKNLDDYLRQLHEAF